jgi:hypothetical protein
MTEPNGVLRRTRERTESPQTPGETLSRSELAELVNAWIYRNTTDHRVTEIDSNYIGKLERGTFRWPQADYRAGLRAVLGVRTDAELGFFRGRRGSASVPPVDRQDFIRAAVGVTAGAVARPLVDLLPPERAVSAPSVVSPDDIERVRTTAGLFGSWDHIYGGGLIREAVGAQLRYSAQLLGARCPERLRNELCSAIGFLGHSAAFMAFDAYAHEDARQMFNFALACAEEAGNWHLRAKILSSMARQAIWCGNPDAGLTLVELAMVRADRLTPTERAMLLAARARALAKLRRSGDAVAAIGMADDEFAHAVPADDPPWMLYYDHAQHVGDTGHALFDLAVDGRFVSEATTRLAAAVAGHRAAYLRSRAISGIKLASLTMRTGDPAEAVAIGGQAIADVGAVRSRRALDDLRELRAHAAPHESVNGVPELRHAIGSVVASG